MPSRYYYRELLLEHPALFVRIAAFNRANPLPCTGHPVFDAALSDPLLNRAWEKRLGATEHPTAFWDFTEESRRLALLPSDVLLTLGKTASAALLSPVIRRTVLRQDVTQLRQYYGEPLMHYALYRGAFEAGRLTTVVAPLVAAASPLQAARILTGVSLSLPRCRWPQALQEKTAACWAQLSLTAAEIPAELEPLALPLWHFLKKLIFRELDPQWKNYFA